MTVRVLIVDDSGFFRKQLSKIISSDPFLHVVGTANNGREAIEQVTLLKPDVITMDIEMPEMDGIAATHHIMSQQPTAILMLSTWSTEGAKTTLDALEAGAVDYLPKRFEDISSDRNLVQKQLCDRIKYLAKTFQKQNTAQSQSVQSNTQPIPVKNQPLVTPKKVGLKLVAIGTSTGGPVALQKVLSQLPANFPYPIVIIQHMPATFTPSFSERLNTQCAITVKQAEDGDQLSAGTAYLAPGGQQMLITGNKNNLQVKLQPGKAEETYRPCIDITLNSIAQICPDKTLTIILTGMGSDGTKGCQTLKPLGGIVWSQDEQSSTIYGMPMAVAEAKLADKILSLTEIGQQLAETK